MASTLTPHPLVVIEQVWQVITAHLANGPLEVVLPLDLRPFMGDGGIRVIALRFCAFIAAPVAVFHDQAIDAVRMVPTNQVHGMQLPFYHASANPGANVDAPQLSAQTAGVSKKTDVTQPPKQDKVPRPPNPFILYRQHHHPVLKQMHPEMHNNEISVILGNQWNSESEEVKNRFKDLANSIKEEHQKNHPNYQYQPRKPSQKKRRSTRRKAVALPESPGATMASEESPTTQATASGAATDTEGSPNTQATASGAATDTEGSPTTQATASGAATDTEENPIIEATASGAATGSDDNPTSEATTSDVPGPVENNIPQAASVENNSSNISAAVTESAIVEQQNNAAHEAWTPMGPSALSAEIDLDADDVALYQLLTEFNQRVPTPPIGNGVPEIGHPPVYAGPNDDGIYDEAYINSLVEWDLFEGEAQEVRQGVVNDYQMFGAN